MPGASPGTLHVVSTSQALPSPSLSELMIVSLADSAPAKILNVDAVEQDWNWVCTSLWKKDFGEVRWSEYIYRMRLTFLCVSFVE
jgi:hypothetical protein